MPNLSVALYLIFGIAWLLLSLAKKRHLRRLDVLVAWGIFVGIVLSDQSDFPYPFKYGAVAMVSIGFIVGYRLYTSGARIEVRPSVSTRNFLVSLGEALASAIAFIASLLILKFLNVALEGAVHPFFSLENFAVVIYIIVGALFMGVGTTLLADALGRARGKYELRKKESLEESKKIIEVWLKKVNGILPELLELDKSMQTPLSWMALLDKFGEVVRIIPYPTVAKWNEEIRESVAQIIDFADSLLPTRRWGYEERCFDWISAIVRTQDPPTLAIAKLKFSKKLWVFVRDFRLQRNPQILYLYQTLNDFTLDSMVQFVDYLTSDDCPDEAFRVMEDQVRLDEMATENKRGLETLTAHLFERMKQTERVNPVSYMKTKTLWDRANQAGRNL